MTIATMSDEDLPDLSLAKEFYAKYEVKDILGKGVSSTVRRCVEKDTGVVYAVKIIDLTADKGDDYQQEELRTSTRKEMNVLRMCAQHKQIIGLHDTFESSTFIFLVFELCKRGELFDYLTEVVTLSEKRTRQVMRQLLEALSFIHSKHVVHRDIKPENILLDANLNIKLSDFGFATVVSHEEELLDLCGTPGYLAPEVLKVSMYDNVPGYGRPCDMWACGVIMYTLLVGCPPFWHRRQMYMLRSIMDGKYSFSSPEWQDISDPPKDLISRLLVVDPQKRYTADEALAHQFFRREEVSGEVHGDFIVPLSPTAKREEKPAFFARRKFKAAVVVVMAVQRVRHLYLHPPPISVERAQTEPYSIKTVRKAIDAAAFRIYGHWVKKGVNQDRAALFQSQPKHDVKASQSEAPARVVKPGVRPLGSTGRRGVSRQGQARRMALRVSRAKPEYNY